MYHLSIKLKSKSIYPINACLMVSIFYSAFKSSPNLIVIWHFKTNFFNKEKKREEKKSLTISFCPVISRSSSDTILLNLSLLRSYQCDRVMPSLPSYIPFETDSTVEFSRATAQCMERNTYIHIYIYIYKSLSQLLPHAHTNSFQFQLHQPP